MHVVEKIIIGDLALITSKPQCPHNRRHITHRYINTQNHRNYEKKGPEMTAGDTHSAPSIPSLK